MTSMQASENGRTATTHLPTASELAATNAWQRNVLDSANFIITTTDQDGVINFLNAGALRRLGYDEAELIGKVTPLIFHDPREIERRAEELARAWGKPIVPGFNVLVAKARQSVPDENEWTYLRKDGSRFPVLLSVTALRDETGEITGFSCIGSDISEREQVQMALRQIEGRFLAISESSPVGIFATSEAGECVYTNRAYQRISGLTFEETLGYGWAQAIHPDDRKRVFAAWQDARKNEGIFEDTHRYLHGDGSIIWVSTKAAAVSGGGAHSGYVGTVEDITEREQAQQELRYAHQIIQEKEAFLASIIDYLPVALYCKDARDNYRITLWNNMSETIFGLSREQALGKNTRDLFPAEQADFFVKVDEEVMRSGQTQDISEEPVDSQSLGTILLHTIKVPVFDSKGELRYLLGLSENITERKQSERQLEEYRRRLEETNAQLEVLAATDGLTGLRNHRAFQQKLEEEFQRAQRDGTPLSLLLLDVDHFKQYNDAFGHPAGDEVLKSVARLLENEARTSDYAARTGGEEFAVILPNTDQTGACILAEHFRQVVESSAWTPSAITASFGVSTLTDITTDSATLIEEADKALYHSKEHGRNRLTHAGELDNQ